jgi:hypothetical protein
MTVMHKLHLSLFNSQTILPLRFCPIEVELTLAPATDWVDLITTGLSKDYSISNVHIIYDQIVPDESIVAQFYSGLLRNQMMSIPVLCAYQFSQSVAAGATSVDITASRAFSKISSVWVTWSSVSYGLSSDLTCPSTLASTSGMIPYLRDNNPVGAISQWAPSVRLSIAGKQIPDPAPASTLAMHYYNLVKTLGYSPNITRDDYYNDSFMVCFDLKRVPFDHGSGISSRSGDLIRISVQNMTANRANMAHVTMFCYAVVAIRESAVSLLN